jgi:hypothetical protein
MTLKLNNQELIFKLLSLIPVNKLISYFDDLIDYIKRDNFKLPSNLLKYVLLLIYLEDKCIPILDNLIASAKKEKFISILFRMILAHIKSHKLPENIHLMTYITSKLYLENYIYK